MGFARYFNRDFIALNKRISSGADKNFKGILEANLICIEFDEQIENSSEANICIELLVRMVSRFYPKLKFHSNFEKAEEHVIRLTKLAVSINANIEIAGEKELPTLVITAGKLHEKHKDLPHFFLGSDNWTAKFSQMSPSSFGQSNNPFGASVVACIACSNAFRLIFKKELQLPLDDDVLFSTLQYSCKHDQAQEILGDVVLDDVNIVGIGAIGSACVWTLSKINGLSGQITLIDHDKIEESNLQRYILFDEGDLEKKKVDVACKTLSRIGLNVIPVDKHWAQFIHENHKGKCNCRLAAVGIDNKEGRVHIQGSLPFKIINAYTDESRFGISRHFDFLKKPCLACLYIPTHLQKSKLTQMVEELNMLGFENLVYDYSRPDKFIDETFLNVFCSRNSIDMKDVEEYKQRSLADFYIEMVCGFKMLKIQQEGQQRADQVDVPLSFQSAMAGIMLALEIVLEATNINRVDLRDVSQWQILERISEENPSHFQYLKNASGICICEDALYQEAYKAKWTQISAVSRAK